eukprot:CAMPEP_0177541242 /NCGR_PEP_ID=MMETSP0369-20130122/60067_1 /TAXON_ID=447022 ORGANISM="Scrippsiella hangoei-like, Strain SHHI-4" /NCGR_SAMPLE_ID=MMETSP0369 /ASSEMBLY_ACC=CAM_ASM_000364 /LENGTH=54 /DNA_ID=CAMNT_0019024629 /DNA_START=103 /DNA_END=264 /DNA_ORIENTATION=+
MVVDPKSSRMQDPGDEFPGLDVDAHPGEGPALRLGAQGPARGQVRAGGGEVRVQ